MNRRNFIQKILIGIASIEIGYLFFDAFKVKKKDASKSDLFLAGSVSDFEKNRTYPFNAGKFYISVLKDGGILALSIKCTHLGCMVQANEKGFLCPCHSSAFNNYGEVLSPPATRALDIFPVSINKGNIYIDIKKPMKRDKFHKSQLTYIT